MIRAYLKESLHWLRLAFFKPVTLQEEARRMTRKRALSIYLKTSPAGFLIILILLAVVGAVCEMAGVPFNWTAAFRGWLAGCLVFGLGGLFWSLLGLSLGDDLFLGLFGSP